MKIYIIIFVVAVITSGCVNKYGPDGGSILYDFKKQEVLSAKHSAEQVIEIAKELAQRKGFSLDKYKLSRISFDPNEDDQWVLSFEAETLLLGNEFWVWVNDDTGKTLLMTGE